MDYVFRDINSDIYLFCSINNNIVRKKYLNNRWEQEEKIFEGIVDEFSFSIDKNDNVYIFCKTIENEVVLIKGFADSFETMVIAKNNDNKKIKFLPIINGNEVSLVYNGYEENNSYIYLQHNNNERMIDSINGFKHNIFEIYNNKLIYQGNDASKHICIRDIANGGFGDKTKCHSTNYDITDFSVLEKNDELYLVYAVRSSFSYQLFFRKLGEGLSDPIIISEGQNIDNVLVFYSDRLYVFFTSRDGVYYTASEDSGVSFAKVKRFKEEMNVRKAKFLSNGVFDMKCNDIYISRNEPKQIRVIPDIYGDFFKDFKKPVQVRQNVNNTVFQEQREVKAKKIVDNSKIYYENLADVSNEDFYRVLLEKKKQKDLKKKNKEIKDVVNDYEDIEKLKKENEKLKKALFGMGKF